jgi:hypothetical protein
MGRFLTILAVSMALAACSSAGSSADLPADATFDGSDADTIQDAPVDLLPDPAPDPTPDVAPDALPDVPPDPAQDAVSDAVDDANDASGDEASPDAPPDTPPCDGTPFHGFCVRVPQKHVVPMEGMGGDSTVELPDKDHVCTFVLGKSSGYFYVQATPLKVKAFGGTVFDTVGAWTSFGDVAAQVDAAYDGGGNHQNDWVTFTHDGKNLKLYHSSFGWGWRVCRPMDCIQVLSGPGGTVSDDGCGLDRTHPIVCVLVSDDGSIPDLVDPFAGGQKCCNSEVPEPCL